MKKSKQQVDYSKGMRARRCNNCVNFRPPHACTKVEGNIDPEMWCELFERKKYT